MLSVIYKISFVNNPKVYIGQTIDPNRRWRDHKYDAKNGSTCIIHRAMRKYGIENARFEVIASCLKDTDECANGSEIAIIEQYDSFKNGYNGTPGGYNVSGPNHPSFGLKHSEEHIRKRTLHSKGNKYNLGRTPHNKGLSGTLNPQYGHLTTEDTKLKISKALLKTWIIHHENGLIEFVSHLEKWCADNNYQQTLISAVYRGVRGRHKDIIKVEKIS